MIYTDEKEMIDSEFPLEVRSYIVSSVFMGYELVKQIIQENLWLQNDLGKNNYGYLRNTAVSFCIGNKIMENNLPLRSNIVQNSRKNFSYIQLQTERALINVSQVNYPKAIPVYSDFRFNNSFLNGQVEFYVNAGGIAEIDNEVKLDDPQYYMILTHGCLSDVPSFIHIGVPHVGAKSWKYQYNLLRDPRIVHHSDKEEVKSILPKFKEQLKKGVQGDGQKF